ncbi:MAG: radical SAM protein [Candidatus Abyssobacteria bacterium SURF_5]|jgi:7-carboxy-7-deazaguanine synthase|uniref:7-carboxy-7-deazaguanine synthase n=1 Tax=Abyssobacteria bacterium (strain SURF_5) TaxID=2093360 RepID=A0A3A4NVM1_ABYX5|nr:MAG: radical SAM protein [Candidatus Abyssubacteria bacterium SURF_5]
MSLKINEIFFSIQGEARYAGFPCAFVRLTGCNLRCAYCDTRYAYDEGREMSLDQIQRALGRYPARLVEITGGEPLLQAETPQLITRLADDGYTVLLETNGTVSIEAVDSRAVIIMDIKCPDSGMADRTLWENIDILKPADEVKFVIGSRADYTWALDVIDRYRLAERHAVILSPAAGILEPRELAEWMLASPETARGNIRLQLQLHKLIWPHVERGV